MSGIVDGQSVERVAVAVLVPLEFVDAVEGVERQRVLIDAVVRDHPALDHLTTAEIAEVPRVVVCDEAGGIVTGVIDGFDITSHGGKRFDSVDVDTERVQISGEAGQAAQPFVEDRCDDGAGLVGAVEVVADRLERSVDEVQLSCESPVGPRVETARHQVADEIGTFGALMRLRGRIPEAR